MDHLGDLLGPPNKSSHGKWPMALPGKYHGKFGGFSIATRWGRPGKPMEKINGVAMGSPYSIKWSKINGSLGL